jgi:probable DNA repair protein
MYSWLQEAINQKTEVVTASRRLARELRAAYDERQVSAGLDAWLTPPIRSWTEWLSRQVSAVQNPTTVPARLDAFSSALLMERCLRKQLPDGLPGVGGIVRQANQSWQRLRDWRIPISELESSARSQDERIFARAAAEYASQLRAGRWVDGAGLAELVAELIAGKEITVPATLILAGFDRLSPAASCVVSALEKCGCAVEFATSRDTSPKNDNAKFEVWQFDNPDSELRAAGAWARGQLQGNPEARIGIVSPALESSAADTARLIREGLVPGWQYGGATFAASANVSYGRKLADYPVIAVALLILRWMYQGLTSRELSLLLRSRCVGAERTDGRSRIELVMRKHPDRFWSIDEFLSVFGAVEGSQESISFLESVADLVKFTPDRGVHASPAEWAQRIDAALGVIHWPGESALDSSEFQLVNRWRELLNEFAGSEAVLPRLDLPEACQRLAMLASETLYQPESGRGLVQVLGMLEAAGMEFDNLWITGLDASQWPPVSRPAMLLSNALQRRYAMPDSTPGDTLEFAQRVLRRLMSSAESGILSWAMTRDDLELTASSLLDGFEVGGRPAVADPGWYAAALLEQNTFEISVDDAAPPVAADERIRGGAYTVQRHHIEPFGAFVHGRLGVRPPEPISTGLSPSVRGNIIHNALHNLLSGKPSRTDMCAWSAEMRQQRIGSAIDSALAEQGVHADPITRRIIGIERTRLRRLLHDFVAAESERPEFSVVDVEKKISYEAFGLHLGLRIDRIDRLANGRLLIIDYKTGLAKHFLDQSGNPTDLQLIVYADALNEDIGGLALINVDTRIINYKGAGGEGGPWKVRDESQWDATLASWRSEVHQALQEMSAGDVRINLLHPASESRPLNILSRKEEQIRAD